MDVSHARLCYLEASRVLGPTGFLAALDVRTCLDQSLGIIDGVVIDPAERKLRFFVVEPSGSVNNRRVLLPVEAAASVAPEGGTLRVELESGEMGASTSSTWPTSGSSPRKTPSLRRFALSRVTHPGRFSASPDRAVL